MTDAAPQAPDKSHTSSEFEAELQQLKELMLQMGDRCENMIRAALRAFEAQDRSLAAEVIASDREMNVDEVRVDDMAVHILALRQPVGRDLRYIVAAVKAVTDLERIGDEAVNFAERAAELADVESLPSPSGRLPEIARLAQDMVRAALDALVQENADEASAVFEQDDAVDAHYQQILAAVVAYIREHPDQVEAGMRIASCAKYLERMADHATNIAEMVIFLVKGVDVRHGRSV